MNNTIDTYMFVAINNIHGSDSRRMPKLSLLDCPNYWRNSLRSYVLKQDWKVWGGGGGREVA